ncbi:hypothetical protein SAMN04489867_2565 [Pedococcus dokdonensis]|uniref:Uncharacterized protein n=1 Tax=Pedococcus dokdonensis TaxID=443156 RepID=A0A1H0SYM7_9MICO|nr:hypothetical protein [Pedococcus dokdonensis]SDP46952.1 hypothetical protein SAMN04489867_2565 [Pedococcus dokdonensis]
MGRPHRGQAASVGHIHRQLRAAGGGQDDDPLLDYLTTLEDWWHYLARTWVVVTSKYATLLRAELGEHLHPDDLLLVVKSGGVGAWAGFPERPDAWLRRHV